MICVIDENGYCARHKRRHVGPARKLALDQSPLGAAARATWDKWAGIESVASPDLVRAAAQAMRDSGKLVNPGAARKCCGS